MRPAHLLSMTTEAIRIRRHRALAYAREVDAIRTVKGVPPRAAIGPVLREELWEHRYRGAAVSLLVMADRFRAIAADEGVPVSEVAARYEQQQVRPHRQSAGERLADLVVTEPDRPDWVNPDRLVRMIEPLENGSPNQVYIRVVTDLDGSEHLLVTSFDGSEPMVWPHSEAGMKAAAWEGLERIRAIDADPTAFEAWVAAQGTGATAGPFTQTMSEADFLAASDGMHLT